MYAPVANEAARTRFTFHSGKIFDSKCLKSSVELYQMDKNQHISMYENLYTKIA